MSELEGGQERRREARVELHVDLLYDTYASFVQAASGNISRGGMFIAVSEPAPVGTVVSFEARLRDGKSLIRGEGEVVRVRERSDDPARPKGMAIRFLRLGPTGRQLIDGLVERHRGGGGRVRLSGVRMEEVPVVVPSAPKPQPELPWSEETPRSGDRGVTAMPAPDTAATADRPKSRQEGGENVRLTDKPGVEFEFTLPPGSDAPEPRPRTGPDPERKILLVLAVVAVVVGILFIGPMRLVGMASSMAGAVLELVRPERPTLPGPESGPPEEVVEPAPRPADVSESGELRVGRVVSSRDANGVRIVAQLSRPIAAPEVSHSRLTDPPRHLIRLAGVAAFEGPPELEIDGPELLRVRIGLHRDADPTELHLVLDLRSANAVVEVEGFGGTTLEILVRPPAAG